MPNSPANRRITSRLVQEKKRLVLKTLFIAELNRLADLLAQIARAPFASKIFARTIARHADRIRRRFPVYRTYVRPEEDFVGENDLQFVKQPQSQRQKTYAPICRRRLFDFLSGLMLLLFRGELESEFVARFQQLTGPAMAKGVEDTAFYCFNRFASLNEVGGDPGKFRRERGRISRFLPAATMHAGRIRMLATSTHDTKRSEDVRARINLLSEIPGEWSETVLRWSKMNECHRQNNFPTATPNIFFIKHSPARGRFLVERIWPTWKKQRAKPNSTRTWNNRNEEYDTALKDFVDGTLRDK